MSWLWSFLVLVLVIFQGPICTCSSISDLFESWCQQNGKSYSSEQERVYRLKVFEENYAYIIEHNSKGNYTYTLGLNAYSDLTHHEFKNYFLGLSSSANDFIRLKTGSSSAGVASDVGVVDIPSSLDWREKGAVTKVKNQGSCGACWSFSATGAIEGINKIVTGSLVSLSEQELIDCDKSYNDGCGGGLMDYAFEFVKKNGGIDTEEDYPFIEREGTCNKNKLQRRVVTIDGYTDVPQNDEDKLLKAVAKQPVSVGICGSERAFQSYSKGIFTGPCSTALDHAVLIVGYGSENGVDYWIIKNSWGTSWGINGYMHMQRNSGNQEGICGINKLASYPTKSSPNPPSPPSPGPSKCSMFTSCGQGETCCCGWKLLGVCLSWKCCGLDSAVCCKDGRHCCPHDYPICDTSRNLCLKGQPGALSSRYARGPGKGRTTRVYCTQAYPTFLQEAASTARNRDLLVTWQQLYQLRKAPLHFTSLDQKEKRLREHGCLYCNFLIAQGDISCYLSLVNEISQVILKRFTHCHFIVDRDEIIIKAKPISLDVLFMIVCFQLLLL